VAILAAAQGVFAERGYHASSIDEVARAAGISKALIYEHFASKEDLRGSLIQDAVADLLERLLASAGTGEPGEIRLRAGIDAFLGFVEENREAFRMLFRDAADPKVAAVLDAVQREATQAVAELIATEPYVAREDDMDRRLDDEMLAQLLNGAVQAIAIWWTEHPDVPRELVLEQAMDFAWLGLERLRAGERVRHLGLGAVDDGMRSSERRDER